MSELTVRTKPARSEHHLIAEVAGTIYELKASQQVIEEMFQCAINRAIFDSIYGEGVADAILEKWIAAAPE